MMVDAVKSDVKIAAGGGSSSNGGSNGSGGSGGGGSGGGGSGGGGMDVDDDDEIEFMGSSIGTTTLAQMPHQREASLLSQHTLSIHPLLSTHTVNAPCQYTFSTHPVNTLCQHTLSILLLNAPCQHTLSTHPLNSPCHKTLSTHPPFPPTSLSSHPPPPSCPPLNPPPPLLLSPLSPSSHSLHRLVVSIFSSSSTASKTSDIVLNATATSATSSRPSVWNGTNIAWPPIETLLSR